MAIGFTVLASGSRGNVALIELDGSRLLVDLGLGPRAMARRLACVGIAPEQISGAIITHTHGDHAHDLTLQWMAQRRIPVHCHAAHLEEAGHRPGFLELARQGMLRLFDDRPVLFARGLWVEAFEVRHSGPTFGFRFEGRVGRRSRPASLGYLTDTGCWSNLVAELLTDVDLLALEFNHDVEMERRSGRSPALIRRNLGDRGHLSNDQAASLIGAILDRSGPGALSQIVMLHLSEQCNRPDLAGDVAREPFRSRERRARIHAACQTLPVGQFLVKPARRHRVTAVAAFPWES